MVSQVSGFTNLTMKSSVWVLVTGWWELRTAVVIVVIDR